MRPTRLPQASSHDSVGKGYGHVHWHAIFGEYGLNGHLVKIILRVAFHLPAVDVECLAKIALSVEQSHADEGKPQITGGLEVIAGENAQPARVNAQSLAQAKFCGKISDLEGAVCVVFLEPRWAVAIALIGLHYLFNAFTESFIFYERA